MSKRISLILTMVVGLLPVFYGCESGKKEAKNVALEPRPAQRPELTGPKKRVGVFEFENKARYNKGKLSQSAVDVLYSELDQSGLFILYERADLDELRKEWDLIESGQVNVASAAEAGRLTGVQAVVIGTISNFGVWDEAKDYGVYKKRMEIAEATVDIRVVDTTTGRIIASETGTGRTEREMETVLGYGEKGSFDETMVDKALRAAIGQFIDNLVQEIYRLPWEGRVVDVDTQGGTDYVYINAGRKSGMPMGQLVSIKSVTGKLTDPETQEFLGYKTLPLGVAEVADFSGEDISIARMKAGGGAKRGDLVELAR